jgi:hypothetical protein
MRTRRTFSPVLESMPSRDLPSNAVLFPINPCLPVRIPTEPPNVYVSPTAPIHINIDIPYYESTVGPDDSTAPQPLGTLTEDLC